MPVAVFACFLLHKKSIPNGVQTQRNFCGFFLDQKTTSGPEQHLGVPRGGTTHQGAPGPPSMPRWFVPTSVASRTPSLHYKFPNIPKPSEVTLDKKFRRRRPLQPPKANLDPFRHPAGGGNHLRWPSSSSRQPP